MNKNVNKNISWIKIGQFNINSSTRYFDELFKGLQGYIDILTTHKTDSKTDFIIVFSPENFLLEMEKVDVYYFMREKTFC